MQNDDSNQDDDDQIFTMNPTMNYESFKRYISYLNTLLKRNMPFFKAKFGLTDMQIMTSIGEGCVLRQKIKKKWFERKATILVQYTTENQK